MTAVQDLAPTNRSAPVAEAATLLARADADLDALADRLHDGALQALVVARYACDAVIRGADPSIAREAVQDALVALRHDVWALRPRTGHGLATALTELAGQRAAAGRPTVHLDLDDVRVAAAAAAVAYRLVQSMPDDRRLTVRLHVRLNNAVLDLDATVDDPDCWALRLCAVGAHLLCEATRTRVLLPLHRPDDRDTP